ncbi:MAG TPA: hypothetical protein DHV56_14485 [Rhodobacter sp.]|nr:hypothetical protein [Rhodobacter sp.]
MTIATPEIFAKAHGMTIQVARRHFAKGFYKGEVLPVVALPGQRGGKGGMVWGLVLDKCSPALLAKLEAVQTGLKAPLNAPSSRTFQPWQFEEQLARLEAIRPILAKDKRSTALDVAYRQVAAQPRVIAGAVGYHAENTLRDWVRLYEAKGAAGLMPAQRKDRGEKRVLITREWDGAVDLAEDARAKIAQALNEKARSMIANDGTSNREVIRICERWLVCACLDAGSQLSRAQLGPVCALNQKWAGQFDHYRLLHAKTKDHKAWQDYAVPRIGRALPDRPMDVLIGDVHYVDIAVAEGKHPVRARLIAWMDAASHFIWVTPVFLGKGQGVRQEDVAESLSQVALCPHGGIPLEYYLDNGAEYAALSAAMARLSVAADMQFGVTLAKPYAAQSKGLIEGCFNIIEGIFKGLPGWIGGDRTNKKSVRKGQVVAPYGKGLAALEADIRAAVAIYNDRPQRRAGRLGGLSPLQMLEAKIAASEFVARQPSEEVFDMVFSRQEVRAVRSGVITIDGRTFEGPCLDTIMAGDKVEVLVPLRKDKGRAFIKHRGRDLGWVQIMPIFAHSDRGGARFQGELEARKGRAVAALAATVNPAESTFENQKSLVERLVPNAPVPEFWATTAIDKTILPKPQRDIEAEEDERLRAFNDDVFPMKDRRASEGNR